MGTSDLKTNSAGRGLRRERPWFRRPLVISLFAIAVPALVLLYLGLESVQRQREAIASLSESNLRLAAQRAVTELERQTRGLADEVLRDREIEALAITALGARNPESVQRLRHDMSAARARYPIARRLFVFDGEDLRLPLGKAPLYRTLADQLLQEQSTAGREFRELMLEGEALELRDDRPDQAVEVYRRSLDLDVSASLRAYAQLRVARSLLASGQVEAARGAFEVLQERYADEYDLASRPYGLVAVMELDELGLDQHSDAAGLLTEAAERLATGRWALGTDQVEFFLRWLEGRLGRALTRDSEFLEDFVLARALEGDFRHRASLVPDESYTYAITGGKTHLQTAYRSLGERDGQLGILGVVADLTWVASELLPRVGAELGLDDQIDLGLQMRTVDAAQPSEVIVDFSAAYPFWSLFARLPSTSASRRDVLLFGGATALVLSVLGLGVFLLMRDASRDLQMAKLRADFVSGVSHELKTPLTLIRLYGETLLHGTELREAERRDFYGIITRESERLTHLIEKVLDFARVERGERAYHLEPGRLAVVAARTVEGYTQYLTRRGFSVEKDFRAVAPLVRFDADAVSQAIVNLIDNAIKYAGETKFMRLRLYASADTVTFEVEDRGHGIAETELPKIFDQFYRGRGQTGTGGYGLGLFLVQHIMKGHGGRVDVESRVGQGSIFRLVFPMADPLATRAGATPGRG